MKSRQLDINIFPKGLTHGFGPKMAIFATFFLGNIGRKLDINIFSQGLNRGFGPKMAIFLAFCFRQYWSGKCLLRYSRTKNAFLGFKKKKFEKSKT